LLEVLASLVIGALVVGGLMGLISVSLQYSQRINKKALVQPLLEAAAQEILADPEKALSGDFAVSKTPDTPPITIRTTEVEILEPKALANQIGRLLRVVLECRGQTIEFSLLLPTSELSG